MRFEVSINLPASPEEVWQQISDLSDNVAWMNGASEVTFTSEQTGGVGNTLAAKIKIGPFSATDHITITEWQPPGSMKNGATSITNPPVAALGVTHQGSIRGEGRYTLTKSEDGTLFTFTEEIRLPWWLGGSFAKPITSRILRRYLGRNLRQLRVQVMEAGESPQPNEPGALIGRGLNTEVRRYGNNAVRISLLGDDLSHEANAMAHVLEHDFPAPHLIGQPDPSWIVMERVHGPTMLQDTTAKPWLLQRHAKALAALHHQLGAIPAPEDWTQVSAGDGVCHLDMHPDNVKVTSRGLVVIDWSNAARGDAAFDAALTYVTLRTTPYAAGAVARTMVAGFRRQFAQAFLKAFGAEDIMLHLRSAAELRLLDTNLLPVERESVFALARGELE